MGPCTMGSYPTAWSVALGGMHRAVTHRDPALSSLKRL